MARIAAARLAGLSASVFSLAAIVGIKGQMKFKEGAKVRIVPHCWWPGGGAGKVSIAPESVNEIIGSASAFDATQRTFKGVGRIITTVWINFDQPIFDGDGDGPYPGGEVEIDYLELLD